MGTREHLSRWSIAAERFAQDLAAESLMKKVVVNALPWATRDEMGRATKPPPNFGSVDDFNSAVSEYWSILNKLGFAVAKTPPSIAVASSSHKWGPAPFHYLDETYRESLAAILATRNPKRQN